MKQQGATIHRILVAIDGSKESAAGVQWAAALARATGAEVVAAHVTESAKEGYRPMRLPIAVLNEANWREVVAAELEGGWCEPLSAAGVVHRTRIEDGRPGPCLVGMAEREHADLVVVGRRGLSGIAELTHHSVSHFVTHHSPCPVAVIPATTGDRVAGRVTAGPPVHRIVAGIDGSPGAVRALEWTARLARDIDAEVVAVYAYQMPAYMPRPGAAVYTTDMEGVETALRQDFEQRWCAPLAAAGVRHRVVFEEGVATDVLIRRSAELVADLVVTGRRGHGDLVELLGGSVSQDLLHHAHCPVVVVPAAGARER